MAVLKVRFRLCKARSRISRCGLSIAFPVVNKLPLKRLAEGLGEFNRSVQHSMDFGCCSDRRCVGVATQGTQGLSSSQKKELWERWKAGESLTEIGQALQKRTGSIHWVLKATGGFAPPQRRRSSRALGQAEREEISRGLAAGDSLRAIAACLGRAASSVSREVGRNGGRTSYRALEAEERTWQRARRPKRCLLAENDRLRSPALCGGKEAQGGLVAAADLRLAEETLS
jgi:hypothetical protein